MFNNVGRKIKFLAEVLCYIGIGLSIISGICLIVKGSEWHPVFVVCGVVFLVFGGLWAWIFSLFIYGFGELIEKSTEIADNTRQSHRNNRQKMSSQSRPVCKREGLYEYNGFRIVNIGDNCFEDNWMVTSLRSHSVLINNVSFDDAVNAIDENAFDDIKFNSDFS